MKFGEFKKWLRAVVIFSVTAFFVNKLVHWNDLRERRRSTRGSALQEKVLHTN
jgi:hypothetical protein